MKRLTNSPLIALIPLIGLLGCLGCSQNDSAPSSASESLKPEKVTVYTVNYPLEFFAQEVGGGSVEAVFPMESTGDPAYWKPSETDINAFQEADIILLNGADYAKWLTSVTLPENRLWVTADSFKDQWIEVDDAVTHSHGDEGEHSHHGYAFTTWMDLDLASKQALSIRDILTQTLPEQTDAFLVNYNSLATSLRALDEKLLEASRRNPKVPLLGSHPIYQYLARRYELNLVSLHWEPDQVPSEKEMEDLRSLLAKHPAKALLWEGDPLPETVALLEKEGIQSTVYTPCANRPVEGDFLKVMETNIDNLVTLLYALNNQ